MASRGKNDRQMSRTTIPGGHRAQRWKGRRFWGKYQIITTVLCKRRGYKDSTAAGHGAGRAVLSGHVHVCVCVSISACHCCPLPTTARTERAPCLQAGLTPNEGPCATLALVSGWTCFWWEVSPPLIGRIGPHHFLIPHLALLEDGTYCERSEVLVFYTTPAQRVHCRPS